MLSYEEIRIQLHHLTLDEQFQLLEDLAKLIRSQVISHDRHSIIELEGLGKEVWSGVDVEKYIDEERNSWDG
jgi:hypothetical protein